LLEKRESNGLGICAISLWEVAQLVQCGRLVLPVKTDEWFRGALAYPGVTVLDLTPRIAIESTRLPSPFHADPADRMIVATARVFGCPVITADARLREYPHVETL
jgi:PIN domain nuclease of toxin-antitoxin system